MHGFYKQGGGEDENRTEMTYSKYAEIQFVSRKVSHQRSWMYMGGCWELINEHIFSVILP